MKILFYHFRPTVAVPNLIGQFKTWWAEEKQHNADAVPIDQFEIKTTGPVGGTDFERARKAFRIWSELKKTHIWLMNRL